MRDAVPEAMIDWMEYFIPGVYHESENRFDKHKQAKIMYDEEGRSFAMDGKGHWTRIHALDYAGGLHDTWGEEIKEREAKAREERYGLGTVPLFMKGSIMKGSIVKGSIMNNSKCMSCNVG